MKGRVALFVACLAALVGGAAAGEHARHDMTIDIDPVEHHLRITDRIELPPGAGEGTEFLLNGALTILDSEPAVLPVALGEVEEFFGINAGEWAPDESVELARYRIDGVAEEGRLTLTYEGRIDYGLSAPEEEYTRGFRETAGIIGEEGVYLAGNGFWYPRFGDALVESRMEISQPEGWHLISQGNGSSSDEDGRSQWDSAGAVDEIYLVGGPLVKYTEAAGAISAEVFLHESDDALAKKYLTATAQYLEMYRNLIVTEHGKLHDAHPDRYKRFIRSGDDSHTALQTPLFYLGTANGVPLDVWTADFLVPRPFWMDIVEDFVPLP